MYTQVKWNDNNLTSIKKAERLKAKLENKGYTLAHTMINGLTGDCTLSYNEPTPKTNP